MLAPGCGFDHLATDPSGSRMSGHVEVEQAATVVADQEEDVEGVEGQGLDREEICCPDGLSVVGKVRQLWLGGRDGPGRQWRRMERALTPVSSWSSSPQMRSVPHCGFSRAMVAISERTSGFNRARPSG